MSAALAKRITELRKARGLQKQQLAEKAGIGIATIWRIERGDSVNTETLELVLAALGCELWERETKSA